VDENPISLKTRPNKGRILCSVSMWRALIIFSTDVAQKVSLLFIILRWIPNACNRWSRGFIAYKIFMACSWIKKLHKFYMTLSPLNLSVTKKKKTIGLFEENAFHSFEYAKPEPSLFNCAVLNHKAIFFSLTWLTHMFRSF